MYPEISIPDLGDAHHQMWVDLIGLAKQMPGQWSLIGAQMVALHGWANQAMPPRPTEDADVIVNIRLEGVSVETFAKHLQRLGYEMVEPNAFGVAHRFRRGETVVDVLAPDNVGARLDKRKLTVRPFRTIEVPGGTQAINRTEEQPIVSRSVRGKIPLPNLLAAILGKTRATELADRGTADQRDLAFLLTLGARILDADAAIKQLRGRERSWLRRHPEFADPKHPVWAQTEGREEGVVFFRRLSGLPAPALAIDMEATPTL